MGERVRSVGGRERSDLNSQNVETLERRVEMGVHRGLANRVESCDLTS